MAKVTFSVFTMTMRQARLTRKIKVCFGDMFLISIFIEKKYRCFAHRWPEARLHTVSDKGFILTAGC